MVKTVYLICSLHIVLCGEEIREWLMQYKVNGTDENFWVGQGSNLWRSTDTCPETVLHQTDPFLFYQTPLKHEWKKTHRLENISYGVWS